jgi:hypothetical protein
VRLLLLHSSRTAFHHPFLSEFPFSIRVRANSPIRFAGLRYADFRLREELAKDSPGARSRCECVRSSSFSPPLPSYRSAFLFPPDRLTPLPLSQSRSRHQAVLDRWGRFRRRRRLPRSRQHSLRFSRPDRSPSRVVRDDIRQIRYFCCLGVPLVHVRWEGGEGTGRMRREKREGFLCKGGSRWRSLFSALYID